MADNIGNLVTPDDYITHYGDKLKTNLAVKNLNINKLGFIGYIINILSNTQYDTKQYFDSLFLESFPTTATDRQNLHLWSDIHKYSIELASPAEIVGGFQFQLTTLPQADFTIITKREITFNNLILKIGELPFILKSSYSIVTNDGVTYTCQITDNISNIRLLSFNQGNPKVSVINLFQQQENSFSFSVPIYPFGTHYRYTTPIERDKVSSIVAYVDGVEYSVITSKQTTGSSDETIFITYANDELIIETGSGINGKYIPQTEVDINIILTEGSSGNIAAQTAVPSTGDVFIKDTNISGITNYSISAKLFIKVDILLGKDGKNTSTETEIQQSLTRHIQSRNNLISELDFNNILANDNSFLLFKKVNIVDNSIYIYNLILDKYSTPIPTTCISPYSDTIIPIVYVTELATITYLDNPQFTINDDTFISPFIYKYDSILDAYVGYILYTDIVTSFNEIKLVEGSDIVAFPANIKFELQSGGTLITFSSFTNLYKCNYIFKITIGTEIVSENMSFIDSTALTYLYTNKFFFEPISLRIDVFDNTLTKIIEYYLNDFQLMVNLSDYLSIKRFVYNSNEVLLSFPVIQKSVFDLDPNYYRSQIYNFLITQEVTSGNRMISDDLQGRFLNSAVAKSNILKYLTTQEYEAVQSTGNYSYFDLLPNSSIEYTTIDPHASNNNNTVRTLITSDSNPTNTVIITITGTESAIIINLINNDGTFVVGNNKVILTATHYLLAMQAATSGTYSGINVTLNDGDHLLDNLTVSGGGTELMLSEHGSYGYTNFLVGENVKISTVSTGIGRDGDEVTFSAIDTGGVAPNVDVVVSGTAAAVLITITNETASTVQTIDVVAMITSGSDSDSGVSYGNFTWDISDTGNLLVDLTALGGDTENFVNFNLEVVTLDNGAATNDITTTLLNGTTVDIVFPLKFRLDIIQDANIQRVIIDDLKSLELEIATELKNNYTGTNISYYNSKLSTIIKQYLWVKDFTITVTDSATPATAVVNGIETIDQRDIFKSLTKFESAVYTPIYFYWDLNNITIVIS